MTKERIEELFNSKGSRLAVCVGSWLAYTSCNNHALGSHYNGKFYINFEELKDSEELLDLLHAIGWNDAECEELFIQDYESEAKISNCDFVSPARLIDHIRYNDFDFYDMKKVAAIVECDSVDIFDAIENCFNYQFYENTSPEEYEEQLFYDSYGDDYFDKLGWISNYINIDFEGIARDDDSIVGDYDGGLLVRW